MLQDRERQVQVQQLASQQFANGINAWANYMAAGRRLKTVTWPIGRRRSK
jgi:hypothetical protein